MFYEIYNGRMSMFDLTHLITLLFLALILIVFLVFRNRFEDPLWDKVFRYGLGSLLLVLESGFHLWVAIKGEYSVDMIPLTGYCATTNVLTIILLFTNKQKIANFTIYFAIIGSFFALVFVDTSYVPPHFRFFHYFVVHFGFLLGNIYFYVRHKIDFSRRTFNIVIVAILSYSLGILVVDLIFTKNYFYFMESPVSAISDFFGMPLYPILWILTIYGFMELLRFLLTRNKAYRSIN